MISGLRLPLIALFVTLLSGCEAALSVDLSAEGSDSIESVVLSPSSVQLLVDDGSVISLGKVETAPLDLIQLGGGERINLGSDEGKSGVHYTGVRALFDSDNAHVALADGTEIPLTLSDQAGFSSIDLELDDSETATLILTLDLHFSLLDQRNSLGLFKLRPVLRAANLGTAGSISGTVAQALLADRQCQGDRPLGRGTAIYLYAGHDQTPTDYYSTQTATRTVQPLAAAPIRYDPGTGLYLYQIDFLPPGTYTLALTCNADQDQPDADDALTFSHARNVTIAAQQALISDFAGNFARHSE